MTSTLFSNNYPNDEQTGIQNRRKEVEKEES